MKTIIPIVAFVFAASLTSCVRIVNDHKLEVNLTEFDKEEIDTIFPIEDWFESILVYNSGEITLVQDTACAIRYHGMRAKAKNLEMEFTEEGMVQFDWTNHKLHGGHLYISMPKLTGIMVCGAAEVECKNWNQDAGLSIDIEGAGDFEFENTTFGDIDFRLSGSSDIEMKRLTAEDISMQVNGAADIDFEGIKANDVLVDASGAADMKISGKVHSFQSKGSGAANIDQRGLVIN